ncbi:MAG: hypothetical protein IT158_09890 [Bryobacterales bacterium]|nr:hypothetical protein [Bryobacterales bacterium]
MYTSLDTLKREILEYLDKEGFAIFRGHPRNIEDNPSLYWDTEASPDFRAYLRVAAQLGVKLVVFSQREFESGEIDDALDELEECDFTPEESRNLERRLRDMRVFEGRTCALRLAFDYNSRFCLFEIRADWFDEFLETAQEIESRLPDLEDDDDSLGGLYSNN